MKKLLIALIVVAVAFVAIGLALPTEYSIERTVTIDASPRAVHEYVGDLEKWPQWTPWIEQDPTIETTIEKAKGVGAHQSWTGDSGSGELTFTKSDPQTGIAYDMKFIAGEVEVPAKSVMSYRKEGESTVVEWTMEGDVAEMAPPVVGGYVQLALKFSVGGMFDRGLEKLKSAVEGQG